MAVSRKVAVSAGVAGDGKAWGTGCAFVDHDRDGKLDLLVASYVRFDIKTAPEPGQGVRCVWKGSPVMCGPRGLESSPNILYHSLGGGKFADVISDLEAVARSIASRFAGQTATARVFRVEAPIVLSL